MKKNEKPLTIGISKQGRVLPEIQKLIKGAGYTGLNWKNNKEIMVPDANILLVLVKGIEEIAYRVDEQLVDGLMIGSDIAMESNLIIQNETQRRGGIFKNLMESVVDTERCQAKLSLLQPTELDLQRAMEEGVNLEVLSKYSLLARKEVDSVLGNASNVYVREIESQADVLAGTTRSLAYDIVSSGKTSRRAGLEESYWKYIEDDITVPKPIPTSLQLFNTIASSQDNRMIDFTEDIKSFLERRRPSMEWGFPDRVAATNGIRPMWGALDQALWDKENKDCS